MSSTFSYSNIGFGCKGLIIQNVKEKNSPTLDKCFQSNQNADDVGLILAPTFIYLLLHLFSCASYSSNKED
jgi:hypothetical protein